MMEWNKPVKSRKSYLWNAKLDSVSKDLTLWTIMNKAKAARDETDQSKVEFGMVIDKIEQRDYDIRDLTGELFDVSLFSNLQTEKGHIWCLTTVCCKKVQLTGRSPVSSMSILAPNEITPLF